MHTGKPNKFTNAYTENQPRPNNFANSVHSKLIPKLSYSGEVEARGGVHARWNEGGEGSEGRGACPVGF